MKKIILIACFIFLYGCGGNKGIDESQESQPRYEQGNVTDPSTGKE